MIYYNRLYLQYSECPVKKMENEMADLNKNVTVESLRKKLQHLNVSTVHDHDAESLKAELRLHTIRRISSSKEAAIIFLKEAGICDEKGKLARIYK